MDAVWYNLAAFMLPAFVQFNRFLISILCSYMREHAFTNASIAEKQIDGITELREFDVSYPYSSINPRLTLSSFPPTLA
ncbi:unnamed protein product [Rotaria sordida]|uniref:Uncharacterized protein n=1 Tax=Rotaria sordida TaxID=392033 RepID=A0A814ZS21_9BILA|nr:unnamed protein product [Rotaria sordida]